MTEEEKKAIETMQHWIDYEKQNKDKINKADELIKIQEIILNLIQKQQKEIEKKDKIIDEMAKNILTFRADTILPTTIEGIKQYFENKVEGEQRC